MNKYNDKKPKIEAQPFLGNDYEAHKVFDRPKALVIISGFHREMLYIDHNETTIKAYGPKSKI